MTEKHNKSSITAIIAVLATFFLVAAAGVPRNPSAEADSTLHRSTSEYEELSRQIDHRDDGARAVLGAFADGR